MALVLKIFVGNTKMDALSSFFCKAALQICKSETE